MSDDVTAELARLRADNQRLRDEVERLRAELQRLGRHLAPPPASPESAAEDSEIQWGYQRGDLEDDLGVD